MATLLAVACVKDSGNTSAPTPAPDAAASGFGTTLEQLAEAASPSPDSGEDSAPPIREETGGALSADVSSRSDASREVDPAGKPPQGASGGANGSDTSGGRARFDASLLDALHSTREDEGVAQAELLGATQGLEGKHYVAGNEKTLRVFAKHLEGLGGGYMGVGTDQGYVFVGWMDADFAWFVDYDPVVKSVHDVYLAFFDAATTPDEFMRLWSPEGKDDALAILDAQYDGNRHRRARGVYTKWRGWIARRLVGQRKDHEGAGVPSVLWDQAQYDRVRSMVQERRIRPMTGNLLERKAIPALAKSATDAGIPVRVLYLSNAEEYWNVYPRAFKANVAELPFDEKSIVVRTLLTWSDNEDYRYNVQPARNYVAWLGQPWLRRVYQMIPRTKPAEPRPEGFVEFSFSNDDPNDSTAARRAQKAEAAAARK